MKIPKLGVSGFNGFQQFDNVSEQMIPEFRELNISTILAKKNLQLQQNIQSFVISCSCSYTAIGINQTLYLNGLLNNKLSNALIIEFNDTIKQISTNDDLCLILLNNGNVYKQIIKSNKLEKLQFLNVENKIRLKRKIFESETKCLSNSDNNIHQPEQIILIKCTQTFSVALSNENVLYCIPTKIYTFPKHIKIKKITCGAEHILILSTNGDVYSFGSSTRGQCGSGILETEETPKIIEALAGIKIIDIGAGFWHSAAVSSFGDLYTWGWNVNGQLGLATYNLNSKTEPKEKLPSVFVLPQIVDIENSKSSEEFEQEVNISNVYCGSKHTIIKTTHGKLFGCGWNKYGQLGILKVKSIYEKDNVILFNEINIIENLTNINDIICGNWSTILTLEND